MVDLNDGLLLKLYGADRLEDSRARFCRLAGAYRSLFGTEPKSFFSAPGRSEIGGNHTDHNAGRVLAAAVTLDTLAAVSPRDDGVIRLASEGYPEPFVIDTSERSIFAEETGTTAALIRGVAARMKELGHAVGGFDAAVKSSVLRGSGLSSSAAFEVLIVTILDHLYGDGGMDGKIRAMIAQYAENVYFGKPCGLMDQTASAVGALVTIDFAKAGDPLVEKVDFDFASTGYALVVVDTGGDHSDLTPHYAAIPSEMRQVAAAMGKTVLREVDPDAFYAEIPNLRGKVPDRALLRAMHFFADNERVLFQVEALKKNDFPRFLNLVNESGESSWKLLQNCATEHHQGVTLALALSARALEGRGATRVHGGGFAGTIQAFVPKDMLAPYCRSISSVFGPRAVTVLGIRPYGAMKIC